MRTFLSCSSILAGTALYLVATPAVAQTIPSGAARSPLLNGTTPFSQKLILFEEIGLQPLPPADAPAGERLPVPGNCDSSPGSSQLDAFLKKPLWPQPREQANTTRLNQWLPQINTCLKTKMTISPIEGRPPGVDFAHQRFYDEDMHPTVYFQSATAGARKNGGLRDSQQMHAFSAGTEFGPGGLYYTQNGLNGTNKGVEVRLHPKLPVQEANSVWTFDGTFPPKLVMARYGEPVLFRHYNALPISPTANKGFGLNQITTHHHNGHNPAESDGFAGAYFFPGQFYDYRWPLILSGHDRWNTDYTDPRAGSPDSYGGDRLVRGDWRETMSTHWFHDHRIDHTAENVYKGMAAMMNIYSAIDRGKEGLKCHYANPTMHVNLCFPSGNYLDWGNRDYDINMAIADKAWNSKGQLYFHTLNRDGFMGDQITVNWAYKPYLDVRPRRYRLRLLNASVARMYKIAFVTAAGERVPFYMIGNDGNIMEHAVKFPNAESQELPLQGIAERFEVIIDFSAFPQGTKIYMVNLAQHEDGRRVKEYVTLADAMAGRATDPGVGKFLEFRVAAAKVGAVDQSMNPDDYVEGKMKMVNLPDITPAELAAAKVRKFTFGRSSGTDDEPWTIKTDDGRGLTANLARVSGVTTRGAVEIWHLEQSPDNNLGGSAGGWTHPVHIHFEEGLILSRDGLPPPAWEKWARKDVFNIGRMASADVKVALRFGDFVGTYMEHCHNTTHEDFAMLLRYDVNNPGSPALIRAPLPNWDKVSYAKSFLITDDPLNSTDDDDLGGSD